MGYTAVEYDTNQSSSPTGEVADKAQETASTLVTQAQELASTQANTQMTRAADTLSSVSQTLQQSASDMGEQQPQVAQLATQAAERIDQASNYLREHDLRDIVSEAESYARREPLVFLGAAFAIGFIAARFLKASSPNGSTSRAMVPSSYYGTGYGAAETGYGSSNWTDSTVTRPLSGRYTSDDYAEPSTTAPYTG